MCVDESVCDFDEPGPDPTTDPVLSHLPFQPSRRLVLSAVAGLAVSPFLSTGRAAAAASGQTFTGLDPVVSAMHVHGSWSEGTGSWEAQFAQAAALGVDLLYLTDHDFRARAYNYITSLNGIPMATTKSGALAQSAATNTAGTIRLLAQSSGSSPASVTSSVQAKPTANNRLRTSIAGHQLVLTFPTCRLDAGATFEVRVTLSIHPAYGTRPAGGFELRYQFGAATVGNSLDASGRVGTVGLPTPAAGSSATLDLVADVQALWPDMLAFDNAFQMLTLVATSPQAAVVADLQVKVAFLRSQNDEASIVALQQAIVDTYAPRYPGLTAWPAVEISRMDPHVNTFGVPQFIPDQQPITAATLSTWYPQMVAGVHAQGGLVSWNHPFGASGGPFLPQATQDANRRSVFASMMNNGRYGTDVLEVGYAIRGGCNIGTHLALWDTFSRWAVFVTGTGANDDHNGTNWSILRNGFATGIWAASAAQPDVVAALSAGRAYTYHLAGWPGGGLDMLADATIPMGSVCVGSPATRTLVVQAANLPTGSKVEVVRGPVDYTGNDPGSQVVKTVTAATFGTSGTASVTVDTSTSCFVRVQVRNSGGTIVGIGNPIWFLTAAPTSGIPTARQLLPS